MALPTLTTLPVRQPDVTALGTVRKPDVAAFNTPLQPTTAQPPNFQDILSRLNKPMNLGNNDLFNKAVTASTVSGISPETQQILDIIKQKQDQSQQEGIAAAESLAAKRGITGSSTEQFGTQQAIESASRAGLDATTAALTNNMNQNQDLKKLQIQGLFQGAGLELSSQADLDKVVASLTSDEIASLRNMDFQQQSLALQQRLGQLGIDIANKNIDAQKDISKQNSQYGLLGSVLQGATPFALSKLLTPGSAAIPAAGGFTPYAASGLPGPFAAGSAAPAGFVPGAGSVAAAGAGAYALDKFGKPILTAKLGQTVGAGARQLLNPVGATISLGKDLVTNPGKTISNAVGGGGKHEQMMGDVAWAQNMTGEEQAVNLGKPGMSVNYDSNSKGSWERNTNKLLSQFTPDLLVARYSKADPGQFGTALDRAQKASYDKAVQLNGGRPIIGPQFSAFLKDNSHLIKAANIVDQVFV